MLIFRCTKIRVVHLSEGPTPLVDFCSISADLKLIFATNNRPECFHPINVNEFDQNLAVYTAVSQYAGHQTLFPPGLQSLHEIQTTLITVRDHPQIHRPSDAVYNFQENDHLTRYCCVQFSSWGPSRCCLRAGGRRRDCRWPPRRT